MFYKKNPNSQEVLIYGKHPVIAALSNAKRKVKKRNQIRMFSSWNGKRGVCRKGKRITTENVSRDIAEHWQLQIAQTRFFFRLQFVFNDVAC